MRTRRLNWMTVLPALLGLAGCLQVEAVPVVDAGVRDDVSTPDQAMLDPDMGTLDPDMGERDPTANWPALAHDFGREINQVYPCANALLWTFGPTQDALGNLRNDAQVWAWEVGGTPQMLAANVPLFPGLAGCHDGRAYWSEMDGAVASLYRRSTLGGAPAELVHAGGSMFWSMGEDGLLSRLSGDREDVELFDIEDSSVTLISLAGLDMSGVDEDTHATRDNVYVSGSDGARIALTEGAEWVPMPQFLFVEFEPVPGHVVTSQTFVSAVIQELREDGRQITLARVAQECDRFGHIATVSGRGGWVLWNLSSGSGACSEVGRAAIDEDGNARFQPLPGISQWAKEMSTDTNSSWRIGIRVVQFGHQIAFVDILRGTIRLADEPPFLCIDPTLPCPEGAECATTRCSDLPD